jgi:hypothetical protein
MTVKTLLTLFGAAVLLGCEGLANVMTGGAAASPPVSPADFVRPPVNEANPFSCSAPAGQEPLEASFAHRLTRRQLERTWTDVLGRFLGGAKAASLVSSALATVSLPPEAERYKRWNNDFTSVHAQGLFQWADAVAESAAAAGNYEAFVAAAINLRKGTCASFSTTAPSVECQKQLIRNLALRLLRRPLSESSAQNEVEDYRREYTAAPDAAVAFGNLLFRMLLAPNALFHLEVNETVDPASPGVLRLSSHSVANRLSYAFWNGPPDEALLTLAETTDLSSDAGFASALDAVLAKRAAMNDSVQEFLGDWLRLDKVPQFQSNNAAAFALYAGDVRYDAALRTEMLSEVGELGAYVLNSGGTLSDLFTTEVSFARGPELMKLYGVTTPAPAEVTATQRVMLTGAPHPGLLTRAALLVSASGNKNPVLRGVHIRQDILCLPNAPPPPNLPADALTLPAFDVNLTVRERYAQKTSVQPCVGCHTYLNPPGYALSHYNGLGRYEETEPAFDQTGAYANKRIPVDSAVDLSVVFGEGTRVSTSRELATLLGDRPETRRCFTEQYAGYFLARPVTENDGCRLNRVYAALREHRPLKDALRELAVDPSFRRRKL